MNMGMFPGPTETFIKEIQNIDKLILQAGYERLFWSSLVCNEFYKRNKYWPMWTKNGLVYGHYHVLYELKLAQPFSVKKKTFASLAYWLDRKKEFENYCHLCLIAKDYSTKIQVMDMNENIVEFSDWFFDKNLKKGEYFIQFGMNNPRILINLDKNQTLREVECFLL